MTESKPSPRAEAADSRGAQPAAAERKRILLVEGDGFTRLVLLLRLRLAGFGVDFTSNGVLGLGKLRSCHPDILLVELKLCGLSGLELIKAARVEPSFGERPIYVFTHAQRMNRATRKEVGQLATKLFDKSSVTREDLVQIFASTFLKSEPAAKSQAAEAGAQLPIAALSEVVLSGAIEELIDGVREQSELFARETGDRAASGGELLSRVSSLASCAKEAGLLKLARHAQALEKFLSQLGSRKEARTEEALVTVTRAVDVMSRMSFETTGAEQTGSGFSAVFVDEAPDSNRAMEEALLHAGCKPICFEDPGRAREYLSSNRTDLILANVVLPEAHGLALADIRQLPLHAETPVVFGPGSSVATPLREELPTSAPRLDRAPLLLTELVVKALNEVQSANTSTPACPLSSPQAPRARRQASLPNEDGFELFAQASPEQEVTQLHLAAQSAPVPTDTLHQPQAFNHLFTSADIPSEPFFRAEPAVPAADHGAEFRAGLVAAPVDGIQQDERPVEAIPPWALEVETGRPPEPESASEDEAAVAAGLAAAAGDTGQSVPAINVTSELEQNGWVAVQESAASTSNYGKVMNNQRQATPANYPQDGEPVNGHRSQREELAARVCDAEMALYHAQAEIEQKDKAIATLQSQLAEATVNQGQPGQPLAVEIPTEGSVEQKTQARCAELEQEVAALRQAIEGLNGSFGEQQASAEAGPQVQELEQRLSQSAAEMQKQREAQQQAEAELRRQLESANAVQQQSEAARQQAEARCAELEQQLGGLRQAAGESSDRLAQQQKLCAETSGPLRQADAQSPAAEPWVGVPASELEQQVRQGVAALAHATAELAKERGERQRSHQLATELSGRLQGLHENLSRTLQAQGEHLSRISALEQRQQQTSQALERCTADLEQHQAERRLAEAQLQKAKEANAQLRKDLSFFEETNNKFGGARQDLQTRLEASLNAARENEARLQQEKAECQRLSQSLEEARRELQNQSRRRETIEQELETTREALQEREAKLQKEAAERRRIDEDQDGGQNGLQDRSERDLEFSKLQSALQLEQVERKRQETQLARTRQSALDAAHAARALRTSLRRQIREPVDNLVHSASSLLELEMGEEQKKIAEAVLQDILLVQTRLREPAVANGEAPETPTSPAPAAT